MSLLTVPALVAEARTKVRCITAAQAKIEIAANQGLLLDVREPAEAALKSVAGAINVPRGVLEMKMGELCSCAEQPIYIHCATGGRAALAAEQLVRMGYQQVSAITCAVDQVCFSLGS
ncbi:rhodanese-like domain-containing protein [Simiduia curdlanivorans]|uniref:Rhodanese-like domain-containing protein n=1 Tax=Simiduia curdlanivorans TaxID=1492769 RepID=A0ABV8V5X9_9GAMM|nr:rhodanese-like domain-containing protein [Simiduia curdlanivorans]MDN3638638.1 rhodanese-like domain-containing protein [Simiduia curdlanivorans]